MMLLVNQWLQNHPWWTIW